MLKEKLQQIRDAQESLVDAELEVSRQRDSLGTLIGATFAEALKAEDGKVLLEMVLHCNLGTRQFLEALPFIKRDCPEINEAQ